MENILITGGAGFIGSYLTKNLVAAGYNVRILDCMTEQIHGKDYTQSPLYKFVKDIADVQIGNVRSRKDWLQALKNIDVVVHLAAETGTGQSMYEIAHYTEANINGTALMLDVLTNNENRVKKLIISSSRAVYGEGKYKCCEHGVVYPDARLDNDMQQGDFAVKCPFCHKNVELLATDENSRLKPSSVYGLTKVFEERLSMMIGKNLHIPVVVLRFQNVYGAGQSLKNPYTGILSVFSTRIMNNHEINIFEDGKESRDFIYVEDVAEAIALCIKSSAANFMCFNVGMGQSTDVLTIAKILTKIYGKDMQIRISGNYRVGDIRHNFADGSLIREKLGFEPKISIAEGLKKFAEWVKTQRIEKDNFDKSIQEMQEKGLYK